MSERSNRILWMALHQNEDNVARKKFKVGDYYENVSIIPFRL